MKKILSEQKLFYQIFDPRGFKSSTKVPLLFQNLSNLQPKHRSMLYEEPHILD